MKKYYINENNSVFKKMPDGQHDKFLGSFFFHKASKKYVLCQDGHPGFDKKKDAVNKIIENQL